MNIIEQAIAAHRNRKDIEAENEQLRALVDDLGKHLTALCNHPENWEHRYDIAAGKPCPGCYDARDAFEAWRTPSP